MSFEPMMEQIDKHFLISDNSDLHFELETKPRNSSGVETIPLQVPDLKKIQSADDSVTKKNVTDDSPSDVLSCFSKSTMVDSSDQNSVKTAPEIPVKKAAIFDLMSFARLVCNNKTCVTENKLFSATSPRLLHLKQTKTVQLPIIKH